MPDKKKPSHLVVIGASAGGLDPIKRFFETVPDKTGFAFVLIQHLSPDFKSLMKDLLVRHTKLEIKVAEEKMSIESDTIYLIPPRQNLTIKNSKLHLADQDSSQTINMPIDAFFSSAAKNFKKNVIGIILSGTGSDGSRGVKDIHDAGGLVVVQDETSSDFDGMPVNAVATGVVDFILHPDAMFQTILNHIKHPLGENRIEKKQVSEEENELSVVFGLFKEKYNIDFSCYKPPTIMRRIERRVLLTKSSNLEEYLLLLHDDPAELSALYRDLLVDVTQFFRDQKAFEIIEKKVVPNIVDHAKDQSVIRLWIPGCSTGEEAYSMAILFAEYIEKKNRNVEIKVFATDAHAESLEQASLGLYSESSMKGVSENLKEKYFIRSDNRYQVTQQLRRLVVFSPQNLTKDPPFTKIDLISCRNVLIYLNAQAQKKIFEYFYFGLKKDGFLFLGPSESMGHLENEFEITSRRWKIFKKKNDRKIPIETTPPYAPLISDSLISKFRKSSIPRASFEASVDELYSDLLKHFIPSSLLVSDRMELLHVFGNANRFLELPEGKATNDILKMVSGDLRVAFSAAIHRAAKEKKEIAYRDIKVQTEECEEYIKIRVVPFETKKLDTTQYLLSLEKVQPVKKRQKKENNFDPKSESAQRIIELENELGETKEHLQSTIEELETSNEELQSTNEELVAANEEMQSTNEELHSLNEELYTVNMEYQEKINELLQLTNDVNNMLTSTEIGVVFVDRELNIRKFTPSAAQVFNLISQDVGRPISHISNNIDDPDIFKDIQKVSASGQMIEREIQNTDGQNFLLRILPYRTELQLQDGVVLALVDINELTKTKNDLIKEIESRKSAELLIRDLYEHAPDSMASIEPATGKIVECNQTLCDVLNYEKDELIGLSVFDIYHEDSLESAKEAYHEFITKGSVSDAQLQLISKKGKVIDVSLNASAELDQDGKIIANRSVWRDIHLRKKAELALQKAKEELEVRVVERTTDLINSRERLDLAVEGSNVGIWDWFDVSQSEEWWSTKFYEILGYRKNEIKADYQTFKKLLHPEDFDYVTTEVDKALSGESDFDVEYRLKHKSGDFRWFHARAKVIRDEKGKAVRMTGTIIDNHDLKTALDGLKSRTLDLERSNYDLEQFAYVASHDLQEPIRRLVSFSQLFERKYKDIVDQKGQEYIDFVVQGALRMQVLIEDLLRYSRVGQQNFTVKKYDLNKVLEDAKAVMIDKIDTSNMIIDADELPHISINRTYITEVFQNLISNSIKYRVSRRKPKIKIQSQKVDDGWIITFKDNGIGVSEEFLEKIFVIFERLHTEDEYPGTGIGLALCKRIMERHGGRIWAEEQKIGTKFFLHFRDSHNPLEK